MPQSSIQQQMPLTAQSMMKTPKAHSNNSALFYLLQTNQTTPQQNTNLYSQAQSNHKVGNKSHSAIHADQSSLQNQNCLTGEVTRRKQSPLRGLMNESMSMISQSRNKFLSKSFQKQNRKNSSQITLSQ